MCLGAPIYKGRCKAEIFEELFVNISKRLAGWKAKFLSFGGKITLIQSVLSSIPVHILSCTVAPKSIISCLDRIMSSILWSNQGAQRAYWVAWDRICIPYSQGVLRIRKVSDMVYGLRGKLAWRYTHVIHYGQECFSKNMKRSIFFDKLSLVLRPHKFGKC